MENHEKEALELFGKGCNCCQAVLLPYCRELGLDEKKAAMLASSFGGGIGGMGEVCGAICGMFMVMGLKYSNFDPSDKPAKDKHKQYLQQLAAQFKDKNGSILCRDLTKDVPEDKRHEHCIQYISCAVNIADKNFINQK